MLIWDSDLSNRLTSINGTASVQYRYNAKGLRVEKTKGSEVRFYIYDLQGQAIHEEIINPDEHQYREYIYALGQHLSRVDGEVDEAGVYSDDTANVKYFFHSDQVGMTPPLVDLFLKTPSVIPSIGTPLSGITR